MKTDLSWMSAMNVAVLAITVSAMLAMGCSQNTQPPQGLGSTLTFRTSNWGLSYSGSVSDTSMYSTFDLTGVRAGWGGKPNVLTYNPPGADEPQHIAYEPNGDVSPGDSTNSGYVWTTFPVGSRITQTYKALDTLYPGGLHRYWNRSCSYVGSENIQFAGTNFSAVRLRAVDYSGGGSSLTNYEYDSVATDLWYVPAIGFFGSWIQHESYKNQDSNSIEGWQTRDTNVMVKYILK